MDALSAALSILDTSTKASTSLAALCIKLKNAPDLILALSNEVSDLRLVLDSFHDAQEVVGRLQSGQKAGFQTAINVQLERAEILLAELNVLITRLNSKTKSMKRIYWCLEEANAIKLKNDLKEMRAQLQEIMVASGL
jgi:hypothetical protein